MVATDVYRPAAIDQLIKLGQQVDVPVFSLGQDVAPPEIARRGVKEARERGVDFVIVDTAGRLQVTVTRGRGDEDSCRMVSGWRASIGPGGRSHDGGAEGHQVGHKSDRGAPGGGCDDGAGGSRWGMASHPIPGMHLMGQRGIPLLRWFGYVLK